MSQLELDVRVPVYMCPALIEVRRRASSKPFVGGKRAKGYAPAPADVLAVLEGCAEPLGFDALAAAWPEHTWGAVFRSLLWLRREDGARALPDDRWAPVIGSAP